MVRDKDDVTFPATVGIHIPQIPNINFTAGRSDNQTIARQRHRVDALRLRFKNVDVQDTPNSYRRTEESHEEVSRNFDPSGANWTLLIKSAGGLLSLYSLDEETICGSGTAAIFTLKVFLNKIGTKEPRAKTQSTSMDFQETASDDEVNWCKVVPA
uniref:Uncharacterized protein n=1 Tax=Romanomermis culicivorax TaxID=13658 RepID=A0A915IN00_ROMCU